MLIDELNKKKKNAEGYEKLLVSEYNNILAHINEEL